MRTAEPLVSTAPEPLMAMPDDLKRIEGILNAAGITTFAALADTPVMRLREILNAELRGSIGSPASWPEQARLAAAGAWDELKRRQDNLKGGQ